MYWFSTRNTVGIDISDHIIRAVLVTRTRARIRVTHFAEVPLPEGVIIHGEIQKEAEVLTALHHLLSHHFSVQHSAAVVSLPESHAFLKTVILPAGGVLETEIAKHLPFPASEVTLDSIDHGKIDQDGTSVSLVSFAAIPSRIADAYSQLMTHARVHTRSLEVESQALARLFVSQNQSTTGVTVLVDIGKNHTTAVVIEDGRIDITHSSLSITAESHSQLASEIQRVIRFHHEHGLATSGIEKKYTVLITGGGSQIPGLQDELAKELGLPVSTAKTPEYVHIPPELEKIAFSYNTAIGLAMREYYPL